MRGAFFLTMVVALGCGPKGDPDGYVRPKVERVRVADLPKSAEERDRAANPFAPLVAEVAVGGPIESPLAEGAVSTTGPKVGKVRIVLECRDRDGRKLGLAEGSVPAVSEDEPAIFKIPAPKGTDSAVVTRLEKV